MHVLAILCINQETKLEVPSFTISKDMIETKSCDPDHAPFRGGFLTLS